MIYNDNQNVHYLCCLLSSQPLLQLWIELPQQDLTLVESHNDHVKLIALETSITISFIELMRNTGFIFLQNVFNTSFLLWARASLLKLNVFVLARSCPFASSGLRASFWLSNIPNTQTLWWNKVLFYWSQENLEPWRIRAESDNLQ